MFIIDLRLIKRRQNIERDGRSGAARRGVADGEWLTRKAGIIIRRSAWPAV